jgi:ubiquinone/menaquinone biosynthesis C-methylase UbiE
MPGVPGTAVLAHCKGEGKPRPSSDLSVHDWHDVAGGLVIQVDYGGLAATYDKCRALPGEKAGYWAHLLERHLALNAGTRVLDVGCGTGRFATLLVEHLGCPVTGIDPSPAMLAVASTKPDEHLTWVQARAEAIPFADGAFDACLASQVIHHFTDRRRAFAEMSRVLRPAGRLAIRFSTHDQLRDFLDYRFFPSALAIDLARSPDGPEVWDLAQAAGFGELQAHPIRQLFCDSAADYLEKLRLRYSSVLTLIPEEEYQRRLAEAAAYLQEHGLEEEERSAEMTLLVAVKGARPRGRPPFL